MTVEQKQKPPFNMRPFATLWWGTNHLPNANDCTPALNLRAKVIEFNRFFTVNERDELLTEELKREAPGIIRLALEHYAAAVENGFTLPESVKASNKRWKTQSDIVALFAEEMLRPASNHDIKASELFKNCRMWAENSGHKFTVISTEFGRRMNNIGYQKSIVLAETSTQISSADSEGLCIV